MTNKKHFLVLLFLLIAATLFADSAFVKSDLYPAEQSFSFQSQLGLENVTTELPANAALRAVGSPKYPVRPGDVYTLSYYDGSKTVVETFQIDASYNASISNIGNISAKGLTYIEFKTKVENQVKTFYSYAKPVLTLQSCGVYTVYVAGEVTVSQEVTVWGLTRLTDLAKYATEYASTRDVRITHEDGKTFTYDLYAALRLGQDVQNPYLEPGCTVSFQKAKMTVSLSGAVKRPGVYQPLESDTLENLIANYSMGLTNKADSTSYLVTRYEDGKLIMKNVAAKDAANFTLQFGDSIFVAERINELPTVEVQGAVTDGRIYYQFFEGETVAQMINKLASSLSADADVQNITVMRAGTKLSNNTALKKGDIVTVPFLHQYVTVAGAVRNPGKFIYSPDKDTNYYIALAGGFADGARKTGIKIFNEEGKSVSSIVANTIIDVGYKDKTAAESFALVLTLTQIAINALAIYSNFAK